MDIDSDKDFLPMICVHCRLDCANCCPMNDFFDELNDMLFNQLFAMRRESREIITINDPHKEYKDKCITSFAMSYSLFQENRKNLSQIKI